MRYTQEIRRENASILSTDSTTQFQTFTRGTELYLSGTVGPLHHIQADCCLEASAPVVLSLTKTDLSIPSCGSKETIEG